MAEQTSVRDQWLYYSGSWNPGTVNSNASVTTAVTISGAKLTPATPVMAAFGQDINGATLNANVSADGTVLVRLVNTSGGTLTLTTDNLTVIAARLSR